MCFSRDRIFVYDEFETKESDGHKITIYGYVRVGGNVFPLVQDKRKRDSLLHYKTVSGFNEMLVTMSDKTKEDLLSKKPTPSIWHEMGHIKHPNPDSESNGVLAHLTPKYTVKIDKYERRADQYAFWHRQSKNMINQFEEKIKIQSLESLKHNHNPDDILTIVDLKMRKKNIIRLLLIKRIVILFLALVLLFFLIIVIFCYLD